MHLAAHVALLQDMLSRCHAVLQIPMACSDAQGMIVARAGIPAHAERLEQAAAVQYTAARRDALAQQRERTRYPDGSESLLAALKVDDQVIGAVMLGPFASQEMNITSVSGIASLRLGELELLGAQLPQLQETHRNAARLLAALLSSMLTHEKTHHQDGSVVRSLLEISEISVASLEFEQLLPRLAFAVQRAVQADCTIAALPGGTSRTGDPRLAAIEQALLRHLTAAKSPLVVRNPAQDILFNGIEATAVKDLAIIAMPLLSTTELVGALITFPRQYEPRALDMLSALAKPMALAVRNAQQYATIRQMAITDQLTGLANRAHFFRFLEESYPREASYVLALLDVDDFRTYNNQHGHPAGDQLLRELARLLAMRLGQHGQLARYGGEEFIVALPGMDLVDARALLQELKQAVAEYPFPHREQQPSGRVTISAGLVFCRDRIVDAAALVKKADDALYRAKTTGKNKLGVTAILHQALSDVVVE